MPFERVIVISIFISLSAGDLKQLQEQIMATPNGDFSSYYYFINKICKINK